MFSLALMRWESTNTSLPTRVARIGMESLIRDSADKVWKAFPPFVVFFKTINSETAFSGRDGLGDAGPLIFAANFLRSHLPNSSGSAQTRTITIRRRQG